MRIAQIAPLIESVPPKLYGGTERIVSYLTEELVQQGHDVVLFASGDSQTAAKLDPCCSEALRLAQVRDPIPYGLLQLEKVRQRASEFDILHFHTDFLHFPLMRGIAHCALTTVHGRLDLPGYRELFAHFRDLHLVSVSSSQRRPVQARWAATVHHGLPADLYCGQCARTGEYLAFLGRISPEKRPDRAIEIAKRAGVDLKIAAKVDSVDQTYFDETIRPLLRHPNVEFVGELNDDQKQAFLGDALALLFPIDWPEPFGLVTIEAMACGTPTIAWRQGSVPEVIDHGISGLIVDAIDDAVAAVEKVRSMDRKAVREHFEERFCAGRMAMDYVRVYEELLQPTPLMRGLPQGARELAKVGAR